jgi:hypothetical protein
MLIIDTMGFAIFGVMMRKTALRSIKDGLAGWLSGWRGYVAPGPRRNQL